MNCLKVKNLNVLLSNKKVLENINFCIEGNKIYSIVGPNGGGKTTLIKAILNLVEKASGSITIFGKSNIDYMKEECIGYLPQNAQNFKKFPIKVIDMVLMGLIREKKLFGYSKSTYLKAIDALKMVNMEKYKDRLIYQLSGGQRQRVMIARAVAGKPKLLILDEPTTGLDAMSQKEFFELLHKFKKELKMTILMVTHDIGFVNAYTDEVICINRNIKSTKHDLKCLSELSNNHLYNYDIKVIKHDHRRTS